MAKLKLASVAKCILIAISPYIAANWNELVVSELLVLLRKGTLNPRVGGLRRD